jgi:ABC-type uncharacterized transport system auxiliary subunit
LKKMRAFHGNGQGRRGQRRVIFYGIVGVLLLFLPLVSGCGFGKNKPVIMKQYLLEYPSPAVEGLKPSDELITVKHFFVDKAFSTKEMVYRQDPFSYQSDPYNQWLVNPGQMVSGYLIRDLGKAGLFRAVFSSDNIEPTRYVLQGRVDEFLELNREGISTAALGLSVILLDSTQKTLPASVVFQRTYQRLEPLREKTPSGFAEAMSKAMEKVSKHLLTDLSKVISESKK